MELDDIKKIGVIGLGTMGCGIVQQCALFDYDVIGYELNDDIIKRSYDNLVNGRFGLKKAVERGKITQKQMDGALSRIKMTTDLKEATQDSDLVIEAVPEDLELKIEVFRKLDKLCPSHTILASNTSGFCIMAMGKATDRPHKVLGMHWFNPPPIMKLIEIVRTPSTSEETIGLMIKLCQKIEKTPIVCRDTSMAYGFIGNRIYNAMVYEAIKVVEEGIATLEDIDTVMKLGFNLPMGPLEVTYWTVKDWPLEYLKKDYLSWKIYQLWKSQKEGGNK